MTIAENKLADSKQRTAADIEALKKNWRDDPCWDIECTDGFEAHKLELYAYRLELELETERAENRKYRAWFKQLRGFLALDEDA
jgi:hypothetical protein